MQIDTNLKAPFSYSLVPILCLLLILLLPFIYLLLKRFGVFNRKKKVKEFSPKDINGIKYQYLNKLNDLERALDNKEITSRKAFQELSMLIRMFVYELTGLEVQTCSLKEIKKLNNLRLWWKYIFLR